MAAHIAACDSLPGWTSLDTERTVYSFHRARRITTKIIGIEELYGLIGWVQLACELQRDWTRKETVPAFTDIFMETGGTMGLLLSYDRD
jgi:hypothetical protein